MWENKSYLIAGVILFLVSQGRLEAGYWEYTQVTNNSIDDHAPDISGSNVVWFMSDTIYMYDGVLTNFIGHGGAPTGPSISGSNIVWSNNGEVNYYNGSSVTTLATYCEDSPRISGSNAVWSQWDGNDWEIFRYDGVSTTQITNNVTDDVSPAVSGADIAWSRWDGSHWEVFVDHGDGPQQLTNSGADVTVAISGLNVAWSKSDNIYMHDGISTKFIGDGGAPTGPSISGSNIVWYNDGESEKVYYYNGSNVVALATYCEDSPRISGSNAVWSQWDGNDYEIHFL